MNSEIAHGSALASVYGLTVSSDLDLPELQPAQLGAAIDVVIKQGPVDEVAVRDPSNIHHYVDGHPDCLRLNIPGIMRMDVQGGTRITCHRHAGVEDDEVRLYLLGSGLGAILMQRGFVVFHGNAIKLQGQEGTILCIGDSGAGKSTTAIAMMMRGHKLLADDICPLDANGQVSPGMARAKLWQETARLLGIETTNLSRICSANAKFNVPLGDAHCNEQQSVRAFYWLVPDDVKKVTIKEVTGGEKFSVLRNNVYRPEYLRPLGLEVEYMGRIADIATKTPLFQLVRPTGGFDIEAVLEAILFNDHQMPKPGRRAPFVSPR